MNKIMARLKPVLDKFYSEYDFKGRMRHDPIEFPHQYKNPLDIEVSGFIASCLAYGKVGLFKQVIEKILSTGRVILLFSGLNSLFFYYYG